MARNASPLGQHLVERKLVTPDQLRVALIEQQASGLPLGDILLTLGFVDAHCLREVLAERLGHMSINLDVIAPDPLALSMLTGTVARSLSVLPVAWEPDRRRLLIATARPDDITLLDRLRALLPDGADIDVGLATEADVQRALDRYYGSEPSIDSLIQQLERVDAANQVTPLEEGGSSVVRLVDAILADAVAKGASDLHLEPGPAYVRIRYRVDGVLQEVRCLHRRCWSALLVRLKVMAGLDIAETRAPQDGRFSIALAGRPLDVRVASHPVMDGENVVLRLLDRQRGLLGLNRLEIGASHVATLRQLLLRPDGLILITGPTGSGKTTTLYALLDQINVPGINIMTLEDPVEYALPLIRQTSISENCKIDFASGVRSLLRQDPDVILVGEIRDEDTAAMAIHAALTGHRVFSTLHCSSACAAIPRLLQMGVEAEILAGSLAGVVAQRLVRRLCVTCREACSCTSGDRLLLGLAADEARTLYRPTGCSRCGYTGYFGRIPLLEILVVGQEIESSLASGDTIAVARIARQQGMQTLADEGVARVLDGMTSVEELQRVVNLAGRRIS